MNDELKLVIAEAVRRVVQEEMSPEKGRYVDISRVPLLCQSIIGINEKLDQMVSQDEFWPVKTLVYGFVALILTTIVGGLVAFIVSH